MIKINCKECGERFHLTNEDLRNDNGSLVWVWNSKGKIPYTPIYYCRQCLDKIKKEIKK